VQPFYHFKSQATSLVLVSTEKEYPVISLNQARISCQTRLGREIIRTFCHQLLQNRTIVHWSPLNSNNLSSVYSLQLTLWRPLFLR